MINNLKLIFLLCLCISCQIHSVDNALSIQCSGDNEEDFQSTTEIRAYIQDIDDTRNALINLGAIFKSEYAFTDYLYQPKNIVVDFNKEYIRLRVYEKTDWDEKKCILVHKVKNAQEVTGEILMHKNFDSIREAEQDLKASYILQFSFYRKGWHYSLDDNQIFVESIESLNPTIEIVAPDKNHVNDLFAKLSIMHVIEHPVPYLIQQQKIKFADIVQ
jgi:adenylate cyclase class IV